MTSITSTLLEDLKFAWSVAGLDWAISHHSTGLIELVVGRGQRERACELALSSLRASGWRSCTDRDAHAWAVFGFSDSEAIRIDFIECFRKSRASLHWLFGRVPPCIALAGPDGVGKSTALSASRAWFASRAPFLEICQRQWRPALLPSLGWFFGRGSDSPADTKPRREPGNLQLPRLAYYFLDYVLGSWCKDRNRSHASRVVLYDRCALDMTVDPYRYALASRRGTRLLWNLTPRPRTLILLYDAPARIYGRKCDLDERETAEQMCTWLNLAAKDQVHALIRADVGLAEVARCTRDLLVDAFIGHYELGSHAAAPNALNTTREILEDGSKETIGEEYAVIPSKDNPRFLVPIQDRKRAATALGIYNPQRPLARAAKDLLLGGLRSGFARPFLRHRVSVRLQDLKEALRPIFGRNLSFAISIGTLGPNQKPVLQIADTHGHELGYAKIGWNEPTVRAVSKEQAALRKLESVTFRATSVPKVLYAGWLGKRYVLVQSPCGAPAAVGQKLASEHLQFLAELHQIDASAAELPYPQESEIAGLRLDGYHYFAHVVDGAREHCRNLEPVPCGPLHGDFTAWNIRHDCVKLAVVDWEGFQKSAPAGWDLFHFIVAGGVEIHDFQPGRIYADITGAGETSERVKEYFRLIGAAPNLITPLLASYAAESLVRSVIDLGENASRKDRQLRRTWAMLLALICCQKDLACDAVPRAEVAAAS